MKLHADISRLKRITNSRTSRFWHGCAMVLALLVLAAHVRAEDSLFQQGNQDFTAQKYTQASDAFEKVVSEHGYSAPVLYNLGNAYLKAGNYGDAILNYERALWLDPRQPEVTANLKFARDQAGLYQPASTPWQERITGLMNIDGWSWLGSFSLAVACLGILSLRAFPKLRLAGSLTTAAALALLLVSTLSVCLHWQTADDAIVTSKEAPARISPFDSAKSSFNLLAGEKVEMEETHSGFVRVRNREGKSGWVSQSEIQPILPDVRKS
jgi:tetratricopeptide (TPR) repeat protein